uniref:Uncharacterized protein n=1 Tax=Anguilla anguilla TaxID=7936 RepID=A0A0E9RTR6_ANGAN
MDPHLHPEIPITHPKVKHFNFMCTRTT